MVTDDKGSMSSNSNLDTPQGKRRREVEHRLRLYRHIGGTIAIVVSIATLIVGGVEFYLQQQANSKMEVEQYQQTQHLSLEQQRQTTLDTYLDRIQELMLKDNFTTSIDDRALAAARTFTVLRYLDGYRKAYIIRFLYDVNLISQPKPIIQVYGADLSGAVFATATQSPYMGGVSLASDNLYGANLSGVALIDADLSNTYLQGANLSGAILCQNGSKTDCTNLQGARYNTKTIQVTDVQGDTLTLKPTQWPQGFNPQAHGAIICDNC